MADIFHLEACVQKVLNNWAFLLAENAVLHFLKTEKMHSLACWTRLHSLSLLPESASAMRVAVQRGFIHLQTWVLREESRRYHAGVRVLLLYRDQQSWIFKLGWRPAAPVSFLVETAFDHNILLIFMNACPVRHGSVGLSLPAPEEEVNLCNFLALHFFEFAQLSSQDCKVPGPRACQFWKLLNVKSNLSFYF